MQGIVTRAADPDRWEVVFGMLILMEDQCACANPYFCFRRSFFGPDQASVRLEVREYGSRDSTF